MNQQNSNKSDKSKDLIDRILTFIEDREAEQIQYGLYDILLRGDEVLAKFDCKPEEIVRDVLTELHWRGLIVRFEDTQITEPGSFAVEWQKAYGW